jgi:hypothetical protein
MKSINFDSGFREYALNGDEKNTVKINTTDINLIGRIKEMENKVNDLQSEIKNTESLSPELIEKIDRELRNVINKAFDTDICTPAFRNANLLSPTQNGGLLFMGLLNALTEAVKADVESTKTRPEVQKYLEDVHTSEQS